jgi:hypothetical protein
MKRMWINQPSTLQENHELHGVCVLAEDQRLPYRKVVRVWFTSGDVISMEILPSALSEGWPKRG